jgi:hypothetical protein
LSGGRLRDLREGRGQHALAVQQIPGGDEPLPLATTIFYALGVDLPAIQHQIQADFGPHAIDELYRSPAGRHLSWGPLCGPQMAPGLKKALFGNEGSARFPTSGHALLSLLDAGSAGLGAVLAALARRLTRAGGAADQLAAGHPISARAAQRGPGVAGGTGRRPGKLWRDR